MWKENDRKRQRGKACIFLKEFTVFLPIDIMEIDKGKDNRSHVEERETTV